MKRWIVFLLMLALPIRTVLAVSGLACTMMPMQKSHAESHRTPCATHGAENAAAEIEAATDDASVSCASCVLACCAALAPEPTPVAAVAQARSFVAAVIDTAFDNAVPHALERPPRLV